MSRSSLVAAFLGHSSLTVLQQGINAGTGILLVRLLEKEDYAQYVLAFNLTSAIGLLAEAGVGATLMRLGAVHHSDPTMYRELIAQGVTVRRRTTLLAAIAVIPLSLTLLYRSGGAWSDVLTITIFVVLGSFTTAASQMSAALGRLNYSFVRVGTVLVISAVFRAIGTTATAIAPGHASVTLLLILNIILGGFELRLFRTLNRKDFQPVVGDRAIKAEFRRNARRQVPNNVFYIIQGQILLWGLAVLGDVTTLAEVVALSRFGILFTLLTLILGNFTTPVFARQVSGHRVIVILMYTVAAYLSVSLIVFLTMWIAPQIYLSILGGGYRGLAIELLLVSVAGFISGLTGTLSSVTQGRAWLKWAWTYIPMTILWLAGLAFFIGIDSLRSAALFAALTPVTGVLVETIMLTTGFRREFMQPESKMRISR